jgi:aryl-alcohol dehydrogenase-like predicted oxidoreductase
MKYRCFDHSTETISEIGVGTWQFGGDWGSVSETQALETLQAAVQRGVNFFDTADVYGNGRSESIIGKFLKNSKEKIFVATKIGRFPIPGGAENYTWDHFRQHTENSLKRLGVSRLDLTQLHCIPFDYIRSGEVFDWLHRLQKEGKINYFGVSVETTSEAEYCLDHVDGLRSLQVIFNVFRQKPIQKFFKKAQDKKVALIVRLPLSSGILSGKMTHTTRFEPQDHRQYNRDGQAFNVGETFSGIPFEKGIELTEFLKQHIPQGWTLAQMALRWCLDFEAVTTVIPGAKNATQAVENVRASELMPLSGQLHQILERFYQERVEMHIRGAY